MKTIYEIIQGIDYKTITKQKEKELSEGFEGMRKRYPNSDIEIPVIDEKWTKKVIESYDSFLEMEPIFYGWYMYLEDPKDIWILKEEEYKEFSKKEFYSHLDNSKSVLKKCTQIEYSRVRPIILPIERLLGVPIINVASFTDKEIFDETFTMLLNCTIEITSFAKNILANRKNIKLILDDENIVDPNYTKIGYYAVPNEVIEKRYKALNQNKEKLEFYKSIFISE